MKKTTKLNMRIYEEDKERLNKICTIEKNEGKKRALIFKEILDTYFNSENLFFEKVEVLNTEQFIEANFDEKAMGDEVNTSITFDNKTVADIFDEEFDNL